MVFFGNDMLEGRHVHDAGKAMKLSLGVLAAGSFVTWLVGGWYSRQLAATLPAHAVHPISTGELAAEILGAPATYVALAVALLGLAAWHWRRFMPWLEEGPGWLLSASAESFGLEPANRLIVRLTQSAGVALQMTQTGQLNWNILGIVSGLIAVLIILAWSI